jgi:hypothetical protein
LPKIAILRTWDFANLRGAGGVTGPQRRAYLLARRAPHLYPRKLSKEAGVPIAFAKKVIAAELARREAA